MSNELFQVWATENAEKSIENMQENNQKLIKHSKKLH